MKDIVGTHVVSLLDKDIRLDGRKLDEFRKITVEYGVSSKSAEGSARVKIGDTEVVAGIKFSLGTPYPDEPAKGTIVVNVELLPLSSPDFETGPPNIQSIEYARAIVDRGLRESDALDMKKLCIKKGEKMWMIMIDVYSVNDAGNLADAIGLAALAALKDAKYPKYDEKKGLVLYDERTKKGLELKQIPIPITIVKIKDKFLVDPASDEEKAMEARLTVTTVEDGRICAIQKGGELPLSTEDVEKMVQLSIEKGKELRKLLK
ncbi:MAG: exosome complex protein Rrp42 [Candidatus Woesearchaeota archaeon]